MQILVVDDHPAIRSGIRGLILQIDPSIEVLEAGSCEDAVALTAEAPGLVLVDLGLPGLSGVKAVSALVQAYPLARIAVLSAYEEPQLMRETASAGAHAYITKRTSESLLTDILRLIRDGGSYFPVEAMAGLSAEARADAKLALPVERLTAAEAEITRRKLRGVPIKLIAREIGISPNTVKQHLKSAYGKLGVSGWIEAEMKFFIARDQ